LVAEKEGLFREFLQLKNGLPSHDTFSRLFRELDPDAFRACFPGESGELYQPALPSTR